MLSNNSSLRVATSHRSGTLNYLHISEYGKLCAKYPEKAREVRGALNTVQTGQVVFVESTAEGQEGHFFQLCDEAQALQRMDAKLSPLDFKFHFFPWWEAPEYRLEPEGLGVPEEFRATSLGSRSRALPSMPGRRPGTSRRPSLSSAT